MLESAFQIGDAVFKWTDDYNGPGVVRGITRLPSGTLRYLVGYQIESGQGEFLQVYAEGNLRPRDWADRDNMDDP
jgi:hypothetical protein